MAYRRTDNVIRRLAARHQAILAAARAAAAEGGMAAVQVAPVAQRAGIATGTVYRYFPSKTDLVTALVGGHRRTRDRRGPQGRQGRAGSALGAGGLDRDLRGARACATAGSPGR